MTPHTAAARDVKAPGQDLQHKCLAVDRHKLARGAVGLDALCLNATVGGASKAHHLCSYHLRRPLLLVEDFQGPTAARIVRYCARHGHQTLMPIGEFSGFATICNEHRTGHTMIGRSTVVPAAGLDGPEGIEREIPRLQSLRAGPAGNPHRKLLTECDVETCTKEVRGRKIGLCPTHKKVGHLYILLVHACHTLLIPRQWPGLAFWSIRTSILGQSRRPTHVCMH